MIFDTAFINGKIHTMVSEKDVMEAMLVHDGKIMLIGTNETVLQYKTRETVDLDGKTVVPGFIDTHVHIPETVDDSRKVDLSHATSIDEVVELLRANIDMAGNDKWLLGRGINSALLKEKRLPNRYELDKVSTDIPIYIMAFDGHSCMGNSPLMNIVGITDNYKEAEGEIVERDEIGIPNGVFKEGAISNKILQHCPELYSNDDEAKEAIQSCLVGLSKMGYTTEHTILGLWPSMLGRSRLYQELARENRLPVRMNLCYCDEYENGMNIVSGLGNEKVRISAVKFFIDGAMSEKTAYISKDYADRPGWKGCMVWTEDEFAKRITRAYELGNDVCIHIIGDAALDVVLDLIEKIARPDYKNSFELIHCAVTRPEQIERMKRLPVIVNKQPIFIKAPATLHGEEILGELNRYYHGIKSFMDAGIIVTGGTDGPLSDMSAMMAIETAVTRKSFDNKTVVNPQECISIYQAVEMFTKNAAYAGHEESYKGTLEKGKLADFLVLDRDIFKIEPDQIHETMVLKTYLGGVPQY